MTLEQTPLRAHHEELGAKLVPFGGWEMPLAYPDGTLAEHRRCRDDAVVFDVSHLGTVEVAGAGALDALQHAFTNDLGRIGPGRAQYTHLLDPADASVLDDIIVWWLPDDGTGERFHVMPNASNTDRVRDALVGAELTVEEITHQRAVLAVQGPQARRRLETVCPEAAGVGRFRVVPVTIRGVDCVVAGTGYTGEDGVEIAVPSPAAGDLWEALLDAGVAPAGLGARDTLRLEAGLPLHGQELGPGITPLQAGLGWVVRWDKGEFRGRGALAAERETGPSRHLVGLSTEGRRPPRTGQAIVGADGAVIGEITSGNFSPMLEHGIAMGFVPPGVEVGAVVGIDQRGTVSPATVVALPFWPA